MEGKVRGRKGEKVRGKKRKKSGRKNQMREGWERREDTQMKFS